MALQTKTFTYGSTTSSDSRYYKTTLTLTEESTSIADNTSSVRYSLVVQAGNTGITNFTTYASIDLGGTKINNGAGSKVTLSEQGSITLLSGVVNIPHNEDGTLEMSVSFGVSHDKPTRFSPGDFTYSGGTMTLTTIPRHSTIADVSGDIGATVNISVTRKSASFYHSLRYKDPIDGTYYYINAYGDSVTAETLLSATSVPFRIPDLYAAIPNSTSGTFTLECWTYTSNNKNSYLKECKTATVTYRTNAAVCKPTISASVLDINDVSCAVTGDHSVLVRYVSTAQVAVFATAKNRAAIEDVSIENKGVWLYEADDIFELAKVEQSSFQIWAKDSRGYETYSTADAYKWIPYVPLTNNAYATRVTETGSDIVLVFQGSFYASDINGNPNHLRLWYKLPSASEWQEVAEDTEGVSWNIDYEKNTYSVSVKFTDIPYTDIMSIETCAGDLFGEQSSSYYAYKTVVFPAGTPVFDWGKNDFRFNVPVDLPGLTLKGLPVDLVIETGTSGGWTYRKWSSGVAECWKTKSGTVKCDTAWGSLYYGTIAEENFPTNLFAGTPVLTTNIENTNMFISKGAATAAKTGVVYTISPVKLTEAVGYYLQYVAKGSWK